MSEAIYEWLREFEENLDAEFLADYDGAVSLETEPGRIVVKRYVDGGEVRAQNFTVAFREDYGISPEENMKAEKYFEKLQNWIDEADKAGKYPEGDGFVGRRIEYLTSGYGISNTQRTARFQMQCRFLYYVEG